MKQRVPVLPILALCAFLGAGGTAQAQMHDDGDKSPAFTIVGAHVFDGEHWLPAGTQVRVQHGLVLAVGPDVGLARGGTLIDATGKTLLPEQADTGADAGAGADAGGARSAAGSLAERVQSGHGAIVTGAHADLRLVEGASSNEDWSGLGNISAIWKNGIPVGNHHKMAKNL